LAKPDIEKVLDLFAVVQNIHLHGTINDDIPIEWVNVEQIYFQMPKPKMPKDQLRNFCEYQVSLNNLEKGTKADKETRQSKEVYRISEIGKRVLYSYRSQEYKAIKDMISWNTKKLFSESENKDESETT